MDLKDDFTIQPNFFELDFNCFNIDIFSTQYTDNIFEECKTSFDEYYFYRGGNKLYCWPLIPTVVNPPDGFESSIINIDEHHLIYKSGDKSGDSILIFVNRYTVT